MCAVQQLVTAEYSEKMCD